MNGAARSRPASLVIAFALAAGCGSTAKFVGPTDASVSDGGSPVVDGPADAGNSDGIPVADVLVHADAPTGPVAFVFTNSTGHTIYIQLSGFSGQAYWSLAEAGRRLPVDNTCETCDCSGCSACAVCGRSLARVKELAPGAQHTWTWDARIWELVPDGCRANLACEQDQVVPAGTALEAVVTYAASYAVDPSSGANDEFIGTPLTAKAAFANAGGAGVEIIATQ